MQYSQDKRQGMEKTKGKLYFKQKLNATKIQGA